MSRKLILLNLVLAALVGATGWQLRKNWQQARERDRALMAKRVVPVPAPPVAAPQPAQPVEAAGYVEVAQKMLFAKDRNPDVLIEATPPKPVPAFPQAYGVIDFGAGATAILSAKPGDPQKRYRAGDTVGDFQIASLTRVAIVLEWDGKKFEKTIAELRPAEPVPDAAASAEQRGNSQSMGQSAKEPPPPEVFRPNTVTDKRVVEAAQKPPDGGPGLNINSPNQRACAPGENSPPGTVQAGWRKMVSPSMFGQKCWWELVGR